MNQTLITNQLRHQRILTIRQRTARRIRQRIHQKTVQRIHIISHQIAQIATRWQAAYAAYIFFGNIFGRMYYKLIYTEVIYVRN